MTAPLPAPDCIQVNLIHVLGDDTNVENRLHIQLSGSGPYGSADLTAWATKVTAAWATDVMPWLSAQLSLTGGKARDISVANGGDAQVTLSPPQAGGNAAASLPAGSCLVASWKEFISYRGGHPRSYISGLPQGSQLDPQHMQTAFTGALEAGLATFRTSINTGIPPGSSFSGELVVIHYRLNDTLQSPPDVAPITGLAMSNRIHSQRRRLN